MKNADPASYIISKAQPIIDAFYKATVACGCNPPFKPTIRIAHTPGEMRYNHTDRSVVLVPYEVLSPARQASMDRFAAIGTLGLTGPEQYFEVFNSLLVAHELGHWLQELSRRPLNRWQAEYDANRIMVAFWRENPVSPETPTEKRLENFVVQSPKIFSPMPKNTDMSIEDYFNSHFAEIENNPMAYAGFQKIMVREAMSENPLPTFCQLVAVAPLR